MAPSMILQSTIRGQIMPAPTYTCWKSKFQVFLRAFNPSVGKDAKPPAAQSQYHDDNGRMNNLWYTNNAHQHACIAACTLLQKFCENSDMVLTGSTDSRLASCLRSNIDAMNLHTLIYITLDHSCSTTTTK